MRYRRWAPVLLAVPALCLAACGLGSSSGGSQSGSSMSSPASGMSSSGSGMSSPASGMSSSSSGSGMMGSGPAMLEKMKTMIGPVLADSKGFTLYWYARDTTMASACTGSCATAWPPVTGKPVAAMGAHLVGMFGTITRPGGALQATYKGHPLYTYSGDSAPGQTKGNGVGGVWHVLRVTAKGAVAAPMASPMPSASKSASGGGGGGYGY